MKRLSASNIIKRVVVLADAATVTPSCDTTDIGSLATLSQATTIANPTGSPLDGQQLQLRITSAAAQSLSFGTAYGGSTAVALPATTTGSSKTDYLGFQYSSAAGKWHLLALAQGY